MPKDYLLSGIAETVFDSEKEVRVTLLIGDTLISGVLTTFVTYFETLNDRLPFDDETLEGASEDRRKSLKERQRDEVNRNWVGPEYLHLRAVTITHADAEVTLPVWRVPIDAVDGWGVG